MRIAHSTTSHTSLAVLAVLVTIAVAASACVREGAAVVAPIDVTVGSTDAGAAVPLVIGAPPPNGRDRCTALLRASAIDTNPGCTLDERLSHGNGTLLYPCHGDGVVEAVFGEHHFLGKITESAVVLALTTELDWGDGCHWETRQGIRGEWKRDSNRPPQLSWAYTEAPVSGTGCYGACKASAEIEIDDIQP